MSISAPERLLDLIIALTQSRTAMTREQIRGRVNGYTPEDGDARTTAAFERMFERDKEMLKDLGVPLVTVHSAARPDDVRYRLDLSEYSLPDVALSAGELGVLSVASQVWEGSVLSRQARRALTKLKGVTLTPAEGSFAPAIQLHEPDEALPALMDAVTHKTPVAFTYRAASTGAETSREVEPWQLTVKDQGWYLRGWDRDRGAGREFRLSRISSPVKTTPGAFHGPEPQVLNPEEDRVIARLALRSGAAALIRSRATMVGSSGERDVVELPVADLQAFAGEIASYGEAIVVLSPAFLREQVVGKLQALTNLPGATEPSGAPDEARGGER